MFRQNNALIEFLAHVFNTAFHLQQSQMFGTHFPGVIYLNILMP